MFFRSLDKDVASLSSEVTAISRKLEALIVKVDGMSDELRRFKGNYYKDRYKDEDGEEDDEPKPKKQINIKTFNPFG